MVGRFRHDDRRVGRAHRLIVVGPAPLDGSGGPGGNRRCRVVAGGWSSQRGPRPGEQRPYRCDDHGSDALLQYLGPVCSRSRRRCPGGRRCAAAPERHGARPPPAPAAAPARAGARRAHPYRDGPGRGRALARPRRGCLRRTGPHEAGRLSLADSAHCRAYGHGQGRSCCRADARVGPARRVARAAGAADRRP